MSIAHPSPRVLCLANGLDIRHRVCTSLASDGFSVLAEPSDRSIGCLADMFRPDLVIAAIRGIDRTEVERFVGRDGGPPVVMIGEHDISVEELDWAWHSGAVDVMIEPIEADELAEAVRIVLDTPREMCFGVDDLLIDERSCRAVRAGHELELTRTEFRLLIALVVNAGIVISKRRLLQMVWGFDDYAENLVEVHVSALRRKLDRHGPRLIHTARGFGYVVKGSTWGRFPTTAEVRHAV